MKHSFFLLSLLFFLPLQASSEELNVLFIGNSYTGRHTLSQVVKEMAEVGNPGLQFKVSTVIYGGRTLKDHWRLGTQHIINQHAVAKEEIKATADALKEASKDSKDKYAPAGLKRQVALLENYPPSREKWDIIVLQSYRDDLDGDDSPYMQYAPKYAKLAKAQGARVILYVTTPTTQNAQTISSTPDKTPILKKSKSIAKLANSINANVAPMALIAHRSQSQRPDLPLRFINDAHLNQTLSYMSACALYAAIFNKSPVGLPITEVTDIRFLEGDKTKDRDGLPITKVFSNKDRADLQHIAWQGYREFQKLRVN
ncbi:MAG: hypothetical protein HN457_01490 [Opitutales bacterium]|nr:hypothetical protein [Opitutales bacterium]MBT4205059.1 hypothetical protein [Pseudomonadota bacterium]